MQASPPRTAKRLCAPAPGWAARVWRFQLCRLRPRGAGLPGSSQSKMWHSPGSPARRQAQPAPGLTPPADSPETPNSVPETADSAQPSDVDGVPEDMATLVLDKPALGAGRLRCRTRSDAYRGIDYGADPVKRCRRHAARGRRRRIGLQLTWWKNITGP